MVLGQFEPSRHGPPAELSPCRGCREIRTSCTGFGRFQLNLSRRGRSARLTGMLGLSGQGSQRSTQLGLQTPA